MAVSDSNNDIEGENILLAGDVSGVFSDADAFDGSRCQVRENMPDAIDAASKKNFDVIGVVMGSASGGLVSTLKTLREVSRGAKILLLARMWQESEALKLSAASANGTRAADDYIICPLAVEEFYALSRPREKIGKQTAAELKADEALAARIKLLEKLATEDELTGLKNRRYIWEFARQIIERAAAENGRVTLLVFDIDDFKHYNDVYGHWAGDEILKQAAVLMRRCCRSHDVIGRIGGDEFAVIFWDDPKRKGRDSQDERRSASAEHPTEAIFIARRFMRVLNRAKLPMLGPEGKGVLTISGGLASFPRDGSDIEKLFREADNGLLEAKRSGKNRIYLVGKPENDISKI